jgi:hypothetical protein
MVTQPLCHLRIAAYHVLIYLPAQRTPKTEKAKLKTGKRVVRLKLIVILAQCPERWAKRPAK